MTRFSMRLTMKWLAVAAIALLCAQARADFYLIVNADNSQRTLTQKQAIDIYMGRNRSFSNGELAQVFDLSRDAPERETFYQALTGLSQAQINSFWARLQFSGRTLPPEQLADETAMLNAIRANPNAIGWLPREPADRRLRTMLVLKETR